MYGDDDFMFGLDAMGGDMMGQMDRGGYHMNESVEMFYNKLGEYNSNWMDIEGLSYKVSRTGRFNFVKDVE